MHTPVNHHLRPAYRVLAALVGVYVFGFGVVGYLATRGQPAFDRVGESVLGLRTNLAFSVSSVIAGAVILLALLIGHNVDYVINLLGGVAFLAAGMAMMALLQTDMNVLNFSMATCIVSFVIGIVLFAAGLYGKVGSAHAAAVEEAMRRGRA